ncbi:hypothetical protein ACOMHN_053440 [Nucella lapillus]
MMIIVMAYASRAWRKRKERLAHAQGLPGSFLEAATSKNDDMAPLHESSDDDAEQIILVHSVSGGDLRSSEQQQQPSLGSTTEHNLRTPRTTEHHLQSFSFADSAATTRTQELDFSSGWGNRLGKTNEAVEEEEEREEEGCEEEEGEFFDVIQCLVRGGEGEGDEEGVEVRLLSEYSRLLPKGHNESSFSSFATI